jgi:CheY-like chemotaxis protein
MYDIDPEGDERLRRKVLVVDDNLDHVHSIALLLRGCGHQVDHAVNGVVALHVARRFKPDVVLLDLGLPDTHGAELAKQLRRDVDLRNIRIVAVTGRNAPDEHERAIAAGCDKVLVKPVSPQVLEEAVFE